MAKPGTAAIIQGKSFGLQQHCSLFLWHKMIVQEPPNELVEKILKRLVDYFWSSQHRLKASALFLPREEGVQGLVDIKSRLMTFGL